MSSSSLSVGISASLPDADRREKQLPGDCFSTETALSFDDENDCIPLLVLLHSPMSVIELLATFGELVPQRLDRGVARG